MNIAILGYGVEGKSAERSFKRLWCRTAKCEIEILDIKKQGKDYLKNLEKFDMIMRSPGIPYLLPEIQKAKMAGVGITSATKLFFRHAKGTIIGITGTKGKGTVATMLYKILRSGHLAASPPSGRNIYLAGNIGKPMLDILPKLRKNSITILELSSFQLQDLDVSPHIAVVLDISPDHLNYHKSFKEYLEAKSQIVCNPPPNPPPYLPADAMHQALQAGEGGGRKGARGFMNSVDPLVFFFPDNKYSKLIVQKSRGNKIAVIANHNLKLKIPGAHNLKNASMAAAIARALGARDAIIKKVISNFKGLPHRLEFIREIRGIKFYNDSASTNPAATVAALYSFKKPKILIAGGAGKGLSYMPLKSAIKNSNTKLVVLYGQNKNEIRSAVGSVSKIITTDNLKSAVKLAFANAKKGDIIILSPASAALDQFSGYGERGDLFKRLILKI